MGVLEGIVIATLVLTGAYVGYHAWQDSLNAPDDTVILHGIDTSTSPELMYFYDSQVASSSNGNQAKSHYSAFLPVSSSFLIVLT